MLFKIEYSRFFIGLMLLSSLSACSSIDYYSHLAKGQISLLWDREAVNDLFESDDSSEELKSRLALSQDIRRFAVKQLKLPVGEAYTSYSNLERPYVVWNVYAAPALSFESYTWCYPFLGCLAYRGFYDEQRAERAAKILEEQGYDVKVGGVKAYSTLGVFDDPLLNTFIFQNEVALVELLIHEISHRQLYIKDDTMFNENFASAVATLGAEQWYKSSENETLFAAYQQHKKRHQILIDFILGYKELLTGLYDDKSKSKEEKNELKVAIFQTMHQAFEVFKQENDIDNRYDQWILSMNNASLSTLANYQELVPGFIALFHQQQNNWSQFYAEVEAIAKLDKAARHEFLVKLAETKIKFTK
ncbi:MAG: putative aminopeptidase [Oleiphilaceae bacterium]|jgi:predicted aminopeptidase